MKSGFDSREEQEIFLIIRTSRPDFRPIRSAGCKPAEAGSWPPPCSAETCNEWSCTSLAPCSFMALCSVKNSNSFNSRLPYRYRGSCILDDFVIRQVISVLADPSSNFLLEFELCRYFCPYWKPFLWLRVQESCGSVCRKQSVEIQSIRRPLHLPITICLIHTTCHSSKLFFKICYSSWLVYMCSVQLWCKYALQVDQ